MLWFLADPRYKLLEKISIILRTLFIIIMNSNKEMISEYFKQCLIDHPHSNMKTLTLSFNWSKTLKSSWITINKTINVSSR